MQKEVEDREEQRKQDEQEAEEERELSSLEKELIRQKEKRKKQRGVINRFIHFWNDRRYDVKKWGVILPLLFIFLFGMYKISQIEGYSQRTPVEGLIEPRESGSLYYYVWHKKAGTDSEGSSKTGMLFLQQDDRVVVNELNFILLPKREGITFKVNVTAWERVEKEFESEKRNLWTKNESWTVDGKESHTITLPKTEGEQRCTLKINGIEVVDFNYKTHPKTETVSDMTYADIYMQKRQALLFGLFFGMGGGVFGVWIARFSVSPEPNRLLGLVIGVITAVAVWMFTNHLYMNLGITNPLTNLLFFIPSFLFGVLTGADSSKAKLCQRTTKDKEWFGWMEFTKTRGNEEYVTPSFWDWLIKKPEPITMQGELKNQKNTSLLNSQPVTHTVFAKESEDFGGERYIIPFKRALVHIYSWMEKFLKIDRLKKAYENINEAYYELKSKVATGNYKKAREVLLKFIKKMDKVTTDFDLPSLDQKVKQLERKYEKEARRKA